MISKSFCCFLIVNFKKALIELQEVLITLASSSATNPMVEDALSHLKDLRDKDAYCSYIMSESELKMVKKLGINIICEPRFYSDNTFIY